MNDNLGNATKSRGSGGEVERNKTPSASGEVPAQEIEPENEPIVSGLEDDAELDHAGLYELAWFHHERFERFEELDDIEKAIDYANRALDRAPDGHPDMPYLHSGLADSYASRFRRLGKLDDLEKSMEYSTHALNLTPEDHPQFSQRHADLGASHIDRFRYLGDLDDLHKAIELFSRALGMNPEDHLELSDRHTSLGIAYTDRFRRLGDLDDLENAIEHNFKALELIPDGHPDLPRRHASLGTSYGHRFQRLDNLDDLEKAIEHDSKALELTPEDHPDLSRRHTNLGASYTDRFRRLGELEDLEQTIELFSRALELSPSDHPELPVRYASLGISYGDRYQRLGELDDLDKSIEHDSRALELTLSGHPDMPRRYESLGVSYSDRFRRLGDPDDIKKAIECSSRALELTLDGDPESPNRHASLGFSYTQRFRRLADLGDLKKAIEHFSRALDLTPQGHPYLSRRHANLGMTYAERYQRLGDLDDIEKAIECCSQALDLTPEGHPDLSDRLDSLGIAYTGRFQRLGELDDLQAAIDCSSRSIELSPEGHPDLAGRHFSRAHTFLSQYQHTANPSHLKDSLDSFRNASQLLTGAPRSKFQHALRWASIASTHTSESPDCIEAYETAIDLLPQFIWMGAATSQRYSDLLTAEKLAINAAYVAILQSKYKLALEWLEHARCVVWSQTIMLRSPIDELQASYPDLADRLQTVSRQLHHASSESSTNRALSDSSANQNHVSQHRYRLAREYDQMLAQIRILPGFEAFLLPMKSNRLVLAAKFGPIVVINCHTDQCDALLILPGEDDIKHISLPNFNEAKAQTARSELESALRRKGLRERGIKHRSWRESRHDIGSVLAGLWHHVVKPILDFLGYADNVSTDNLPHITWCPTGTLTFLPFHAAGDYDQPGSKAFEYAISSYTPTLTALLASATSSFDRAAAPSPRVLAIGQAQTPGFSPLPGTTKELDIVKSHTLDKVECSQLTDSEATTTKVLDAMEQHDWVHLACHAHQNISNPTKSGFYLHDGTLDLASINRRSFSNKGLAFLSACQTATGDDKLPDEAIHLASGMLMAGYPSVIATMWSVVDADAPVVADKVYGELMKHGKVGNGEAGKALHHAVTALREEVGEKEFMRWVPYIHIGR